MHSNDSKFKTYSRVNSKKFPSYSCAPTSSSPPPEQLTLSTLGFPAVISYFGSKCEDAKVCLFSFFNKDGSILDSFFCTCFLHL